MNACIRLSDLNCGLTLDSNYRKPLMTIGSVKYEYHNTKSKSHWAHQFNSSRYQTWFNALKRTRSRRVSCRQWFPCFADIQRKRTHGIIGTGSTRKFTSSVIGIPLLFLFYLVIIQKLHLRRITTNKKPINCLPIIATCAFGWYELNSKRELCQHTFHQNEWIPHSRPEFSACGSRTARSTAKHQTPFITNSECDWKHAEVASNIPIHSRSPNFPVRTNGLRYATLPSSANITIANRI